MNLQREVILIFGSTGAGKTHLAAQIARTYPRVLILESGFGEFTPHECRSFPDLVAWLDAGKVFESPFMPFRVSYSPLPSEHYLCFKLSRTLGYHLLVLEEADRFDAPKFFEEFAEILIRGRHYGISLLAISLHPVLIPKDLRREATKIISFRQTDPDDIKALSELIGEEAFKLPELSGPPQSPPHPYLVWTPQDGSKIIRGS